MGIIWMDGTFNPLEYGIEVMNHWDPISYSLKFVLPHFYFFPLPYRVLHLIFYSFLFCFIHLLFFKNPIAFICGFQFFLHSFVYKHNQIKKHVRNKALKWIIDMELKNITFLCYDKAFTKEKEAFEKMKINGIFISYFLVFIFYFVLGCWILIVLLVCRMVMLKIRCLFGFCQFKCPIPY